MKPKPPEVRIQVMVSKEVAQTLEKLAQADGRKLSPYLRKVLEDHLASMAAARKFERELAPLRRPLPKLK